ncbi:MAG TPA: glucose 1-dehydrogenase [Dehalococcoidia bacterium]|nr:glucose 1-dehydrogenase [Dehalococcoidia bacterium]
MSVFELQDKIAIVTGGAGGIGSSIAMEYARAGANVVVASRNQEKLDKVAAEIRALGRESLAIATDVSVPEQVDNLVKQTVDRFGRLDIMVSCAGGALHIKKPEELTPDEWNAGIALNLTGTFLCDIAAGKVMMEQKSGKIINISSTAGINLNPSMIHYAAAKAGVISLTKSLALVWAQHNINVNCVAPGFTATEGIRRMGMVPPDKKKDGTPIPPLLRIPEPENIADLAVFLASAASDHITGELFVIRAAFPMER